MNMFEKSVMNNIQDDCCKNTLEDTKGVIGIRKSKDKHNGQEKKDKRTNSDLQNIAHKTKDRVTRTGGELDYPGRVASFSSNSVTCRVNIVTNPVINHECGKDREVCIVALNYIYFHLFISSFMCQCLVDTWCVMLSLDALCCFQFKLETNLVCLILLRLVLKWSPH